MYKTKTKCVEAEMVERWYVNNTSMNKETKRLFTSSRKICLKQNKKRTCH